MHFPECNFGDSIMNNQPNNIAEMVYNAVMDTKVVDIHTHLFSRNFNQLLLWGIDDLLTYHYLIAETMRWSDITYDEFWSLSKKDQADHIWRVLFIEHSPISEACQGVLTVLNELGLDTASRNLNQYREYFSSMDVSDYIDKVFDLAGVESVVMTNDPFDHVEYPVWMDKGAGDSRFQPALRLDVMLNSWENAVPQLKQWGYMAETDFGDKTLSEVRRFLKDWIVRIRPVYMAVSLPSDFVFPDDSPRSRLISECILPLLAEFNIPFAMMIGVKRSVNPQLKLAGDSVGRSNIKSVEYLCANYTENKFLVTMLSHENQHELCVTARKFRSLMVFGCWWFLNNPSMIDEITRMRVELLGTSFIPQHSDARILDQLVYKWKHSRRVIANVLIDKYSDLAQTGWQISNDEIKRDIADLFSGSFKTFIGR